LTRSAGRRRKKASDITGVLDMTSVSQHGEDRVIATRGRYARYASVVGGRRGDGIRRGTGVNRVKGGLDSGMDLALKSRGRRRAMGITASTGTAKDKDPSLRAETGPCSAVFTSKLCENMRVETCSRVRGRAPRRTTPGLRSGKGGDGG